MGTSCRLAFTKTGLIAHGGYLEGYLPAKFDVEARVSDDKLLAFLALSDAPLTLKAGASTYELHRGDTVVKFESSEDKSAFPEIPAPPEDAVDIVLPEVAALEALLECVPKTGWGAINIEMVGVIADTNGASATDNTSMAWEPATPANNWPAGERIILPRPFCMALVKWAKRLGTDYVTRRTDAAVYASWATGEHLLGSLPEDRGVVMDLSALMETCEATQHVALPPAFAALLDEAAIFSDDIILESTGKYLRLATPPPVSWHKSVPWVAPTSAAATLPLKRLRIALDYADAMYLAVEGPGGRIHLQGKTAPNRPFYAVIATK